MSKYLRNKARNTEWYSTRVTYNRLWEQRNKPSDYIPPENIQQLYEANAEWYNNIKLKICAGTHPLDTLSPIQLSFWWQLLEWRCYQRAADEFQCARRKARPFNGVLPITTNQ